MNKMVTESSTNTKEDELECQKAQEVIGMLLQVSDILLYPVVFL